MYKARLPLMLLCVLLPVWRVMAQRQEMYKNAFTVKFFGLSAHLKKSPHPQIFPNRLDSNGTLVVDLGGIIGYERFVLGDKLSVRVEQGLYADCAAQLAGFTHLGWRGVMLRRGRHSVNGGIGPTLLYRKDWNQIADYHDDGYFERHGQWQYRFFWYGGEVEYNYALGPATNLSVNLIPGIPELLSVGVGLRRHF